ncbi:MAG: response regulator, partial [Lachnospiraceae bacterium]|nr:response regulator [Lachnospiraceae bacterium]
AIVAVVADGSFVPKEGSRVRIVPKPFYCFPVISILNTDVGQLEEEEGRLYTKGVRALVVDDEPMNHIVAKGIFTRYGMVVSSVNSGFEAIDYIRANDVDIIFMDHMMPGMDGVEAMKRIRSVYGKDRKDVPIVALTANAVSTAREMFLREGFDGFVAKPIELSELERVLKKVLPKSMLTIEKKDGTIVQIDTFDEGLNDYGEISGNTGEDVLESASGADSTGNETPEEIFYKELEELGVDTKAGLRYCQNDKDFYLQILTQFGSDAEKKRKDTEKYLESNDYENYEIIVHSIKGTAKMIGNMHLSDEAKQLEYAAKAGDGDKIGLMHDKTMDEYEGIAKVILRYIGKNEQTENEIKDSVNDEAGGKEKASDPSEDEIMEFGPEGGDEQ